MGLETRVAEVIEASSAEFVAQCYRLDQAPPLGALVKTGDTVRDIYGVVYNVETHSLDPGRRVVARGEGMETSDEVFRANPQLARLLTTDLRALVVGYSEGKSAHHYLPPKPVPIHSFVYSCQPVEVEGFTQSLDFLGLLVEARLPIPVDEVVAACLRNASQAYAAPEAFLGRAGSELAGLLGNDAHRLNAVLRRLR